MNVLTQMNEVCHQRLEPLSLFFKWKTDTPGRDPQTQVRASKHTNMSETGDDDATIWHPV